MNRKCEVCQKEFEAKRSTAQYCSPKCRKIAFKKGINVPDDDYSVPPVSVLPLKKDSVLKEITVSLEDVCTPEEIQNYPNMCQTKKEQAESIYRLENNSLEELKKKDISIPNWGRIMG